MSSSKKTTDKKSTPAAKKFTAKKVGKTITAKFDGKTYNRQATPEEYEKLKQLHKAYVTKPSEKTETALIKFLTPKTTAKKDKVVKEITDRKKEVAAPKEKVRLVNEIEERLKSNDVTQEEVNELEKLIEKQKAKIAEQQPSTYQSQRSHERY